MIVLAHSNQLRLLLQGGDALCERLFTFSRGGVAQQNWETLFSSSLLNEPLKGVIHVTVPIHRMAFALPWFLDVLQTLKTK